LAGDVVPITLYLDNVGTTISGQVSLRLPEGVTVLDAGDGRLSSDNSLLWPFLATTNEQQHGTFWLQVPEVTGSVSLFGDIDVAADGEQLIRYGTIRFDLTIE